MILGPAVTAALTEASPEQLTELANAVGEYTQSMAVTETEACQSSSFADSYDTNYYFPGGITISGEQAETMTLAEQADQLAVLGVT